jgi:sulfite oxidase
MAAGQDLEPYWDVYRQHLRGHVVEWIEKYRIGNVSSEEAAANRKIPFGDMFETDPVRHKDLLPCQAKPFCGEPKIDLLTNDYFTPNELFYVRNHLYVPVIEPGTFSICTLPGLLYPEDAASLCCWIHSVEYFALILLVFVLNFR